MTDAEIRRLIRKLSRRRHKLMKSATKNHFYDYRTLVGDDRQTIKHLGIEIDKLWDRLPNVPTIH